MRQRESKPVVADLEKWMRTERARLSRHAATAQAIDYMLTRWPAFTRFLGDGRVCLTNNAAERALRCIALGRRSWLFAGSDRGGERAAAIYTLIATAKLNGINPQAWLADVLARIADHPAARLSELLPWHWRNPSRPSRRRVITRLPRSSADAYGRACGQAERPRSTPGENQIQTMGSAIRGMNVRNGHCAAVINSTARR